MSALPDLNSTSKTAISLRNVYKSFDNDGEAQTVLHDISIDFPAGAMSYVVGPSGCGKTTLISIIAGILTPDSGDINVLNAPIHALNQKQKGEFRRMNVGFIFQQFNLISTISIAENVAIPLLIQGVPHDEAVETAIEWLGKVGLGDRPYATPKDFSGGQQQRVAIARALVNDPKLVICDEPTSALDGKTGRVIMELLKNVAQQEGRAVIIVTHDNRIYQYADYLVEMEDGRILGTHQDAQAWANATSGIAPSTA